MFYVVIFSILAVVLIVGGVATYSRRRRAYEMDEDEVPHATQASHAHPDRHAEKAKRAQSRNARRKRH
jgi:hypothetical protein